MLLTTYLDMTDFQPEIAPRELGTLAVIPTDKCVARADLMEK